MNQRIRHLTVALIALFGILFVQLTNWQVLQRDTLVADARNNRITVREFDKMRGATHGCHASVHELRRIITCCKLCSVSHPCSH